MWLPCMLLAIVGVLADESEDRRSKLPYIADAVGNALTLSPNGPATVGSPVNLLTPDRYEFYTFDESGELVKRLMTLEEIQAIVAAGEETEGLVTFANENQPTIAFNFSQPPYNKVHNVVTNVQNVLKAQMEAHKNKPPTKPTLDTPDVSDSWSLILPSIFGNTGVDITPDKTSGTFSTPETETIELEDTVDDYNALHKEGSSVITNSTSVEESQKDIPVTQKIATVTEKLETTSTKTTTTTQKPRTTSTTVKTTIQVSTSAQPSLTKTSKPFSTTANKPLFTITNKPLSTTTSKPRNTSTAKYTNKPQSIATATTKSHTTTESKIQSTTTKPTSTTSKPRTTTTKSSTKASVRTTPKTTTAKLTSTTARPSTTKLSYTSTTKPSTNKYSLTPQISSPTSQSQKEDGNYTKIQTLSNTVPTTHNTDKSTVQYEKISTFLPVSTASYITERTTPKAKPTTKPPLYSSTTKRSTANPTKQSSVSSTTKIQATTYKPDITSVFIYTNQEPDFDIINTTTITTQSVSPSTTVASTEFVSIGTHSHITKNKPSTTTEKANGVKETAQELPLFDISESFSQIASDLGNFQPVPTSGDLPDTSKLNDVGMESKESLEIDIPADVESSSTHKTTTDINNDDYIQISAIIPPRPVSASVEKSQVKLKSNQTNIKPSTELLEKLEISSELPVPTTIDPVLTGSMEDLLSQIVNQSPQNIVDLDKPSKQESEISTENVITTEGITPVSVNGSTETYTESYNEKKQSNSPVLLQNITTIKNHNEVLHSESVKIENPTTKPVDVKTTEKTESETGTNKLVGVTKSEAYEKYTELVGTSQKPSMLLKPVNEPVSEANHTKTDIKNETVTESSKNTQSQEEQKKPEQNNENKNGSFYIRSTTTSPTSVPEENKNKSKEPESSVIKTENTLSKAEIAHNKLVTINNENFGINKNDTENSTKVDDFYKKKVQKVNIDDKEFSSERNDSWKLISTVTPPKSNEIPKDKLINENPDQVEHKDKNIILDHSTENQGLEVTTKSLGEDVALFTELCNELAFRYWQAIVENIDKKRSFVLSPYSITSMLAMIFMGARGATSGEMNDILKLDDMVTFNPHFTLKNISDSIETGPNSGVIASAFIRELFSNRDKGKILTFYKERANHFYNGHVEEVNYKLISDIIRRRTNLLVKRYTWGRIPEYMKSNTVTMQPPLAAFSANIFQTDCSGSSVEGRDGEMYFVVSPNVRQRRLVPVPAVVYRTGFLAGYDPVLDATAAALGSTSSTVITLFLMPGQQGNVVHSDDLEALEKRLLDSNPTTLAWKSLLRTLLPRIGLELQIPRFLHKSIFNVSSTLQRMGLKDLFDEEHADLGGVIGPTKDLYVSDMIQSSMFVTCGEGVIGEQHHMEEYPESLGGPQRRRTSRWATGWEEPRDYQRAFHDPHDVGDAMHLPLHLRPRQARLPARNTQPARLKFDRPFLYFVRHNPTGMILYVGRYNPRLLP